MRTHTARLTALLLCLMLLTALPAPAFARARAEKTVVRVGW